MAGQSVNIAQILQTAEEVLSTLVGRDTSNA